MALETNRRIHARPSVIDGILSEIRDKIITGELKDGDLLAPQGRLAKDMGISRASLREALNRLSTMGLIETRQGTGTFVRMAKPVDFMRPLSSLLVLDHTSEAEFLDARMYIESAVAALAAKNATADEIAGLHFLLKRMKNDFRNGDMDDFVVHDVQFHLLVAESSHNHVLAKVVEIVSDFLRQFMSKFFDAHPTMAVAAMQYHEQLYEAISSRNTDAARKYMEAHIGSLMEPRS